jgi:hypothetical protein
VAELGTLWPRLSTKRVTGAVAPPAADEAAGQAGTGGGDRREAAGRVVRGSRLTVTARCGATFSRRLRVPLSSRPAQGVAQRVVALLVERARSGVPRCGEVVAGQPAVLPGLRVGLGVGGIVGVDGEPRRSGRVQELAALQVELAAGEQPAGAVVLEP